LAVTLIIYLVFTVSLLYALTTSIVTGIEEEPAYVQERKQKMPRVLGGLALVCTPWSLPVRTRGKV